MSSRVRGAVVVALCALSLSSCGGSDDSSADKPSAKPSASTTTQRPTTGTTVTGTGYTYVIPTGWTASRRTATIDSQAADSKDHDGFTDNMNVVHKNPGLDVAAKGFEDSLIQQVKGYDQFSDVHRRSRTHIDGELALHFDATQTVSGAKFLSEQYYVSHANAVDVITFGFSLDVSQEKQDEFARSLLATWKWTS
jgi:FlaG/FlaF family flagellin (archaellin)